MLKGELIKIKPDLFEACTI